MLGMGGIWKVPAKWIARRGDLQGWGKGMGRDGWARRAPSCVKTKSLPNGLSERRCGEMGERRDVR